MRVKGWERALLDVVAKHRALPFAWGASDCFMLPLDAIIAVTGVDPWPGIHDYDSRMGAARILTEQGWGNVADVFASRFQEVPVSFAQRGDVGVMMDVATETLCGVVFMASGVAGKAETGVHIFSRDRVVRAFKVG